MSRKNDINDLDKSHDLWLDYMGTPENERPELLRKILSDDRTEAGLRGLMRFFEPDRKAHLEIFRKWVENITVENKKEDGKINSISVFDVMNNCFKRTPFGELHDIEKTTIAYGVIISHSPESLDFMDHMQFTPSHAQKKNKETALVRHALLDKMDNGFCIAEFSAPVCHFYDYETEEEKPMIGYPLKILRQIEMDYLKCNGEEGTIFDEGENQPDISVMTRLNFSEDGQLAHFKFFTNEPLSYDSQEELSKSALSWLKSQISDGFGEDLTRFTCLLGDKELTPIFINRFLQETAVHFAGTEENPEEMVAHKENAKPEV